VAVVERSNIGDITVWHWTGDAPDVLLLHGLGNYGRYWDFFAQAMTGRLRLVAPDARGHGESPKNTTGASSEFVDDAMTVVRTMGLARPIVVGHSMGGLHATALTLAHPERVRGLVIIDTGPGLEAALQGRARRLTLGRPDRFADEASALAYLRENSPGYSDAVYANRIHFGFDRHGSELAWRSSKDALRAILDEVHGNASQVWDRLSEIDVPVLLVRGTRSPTFSAARAQATLAPLRHGTLIELDAAHNVPLDQPQALADEIVRFATVTR
jgi:pimeloyl-ACP methyl ester carboxylesterase